MPASRIVLLHSPLLGPFSWRPVAAELERLGLRAGAPAWPRLSAVGEGFYAALADDMAATLDPAGRVVLAVHSGAGALVPALTARMHTPPAGVIFADAILPHPGRSWFDTAPPEMREKLRAGAQMGELPPWDKWWPPGALARLVPDAATLATLLAELEPLPIAYFEARAPETTLATPAAYLQFSGAYEDEAQVAGRYGWPVVRLPLHHLAMLSHPEAVAGAIASLAAKFTDAAHG